MKKMSFAMLVTGMAAGAGAYAAYQKYNKPVMKKELKKIVADCYDKFATTECSKLVDRLKDIPCDYFPKIKIVDERELEAIKSSGVYFEILEEIEDEV